MSARPPEAATMHAAALPRRRGSRCAEFVVLVTAFAVALLGTASASAQTYPQRPVRIVVGQTPGAAADVVARTFADALASLWPQPVVIENRAGAGGTIAAETVAKAAPDGYTLLLGGQSNLAVAPAVDPALRYDPVTDFTPIGRIAHTPFFIVTHTAVPARSLAELTSWARRNPRRLTFITYGPGTVSTFAFDQLMATTGIELTEIPYKGSAQAQADLLAGRVDLGLFDFAAVHQHVAAGTLRLLGTTGSRRLAFAPDVPTIAEQGVPGFRVEAWYGLLAPAGIPADVLARLRDALTRIQRAPETQRAIEQLYYEPIVDDTAQFASVIRLDIGEFSRMRKRAAAPAGGKPGGG